MIPAMTSAWMRTFTPIWKRWIFTAFGEALGASSVVEEVAMGEKWGEELRSPDQAFHLRYWNIWRVRYDTKTVMERYQMMGRESMMPFEKSCICWMEET